MRIQYEFEMTSTRNGARYTTHVDASSFEVAFQAVQDAYANGFSINHEPISTITNPDQFIWTGIHCD